MDLASMPSLPRLTSLVATSASADDLPVKALTQLRELRVGELTRDMCKGTVQTAGRGSRHNTVNKMMMMKRDVLSGLPHLRALEVAELRTRGMPSGPLDLGAAGWVDPWAKQRAAQQQAQPSSSSSSDGTGTDGTGSESDGSGSDGNPNPTGEDTRADGGGMGLPPLAGLTSMVVRDLDLESLVGMPTLVEGSVLKCLHLNVSCQYWYGAKTAVREVARRGARRVGPSNYEVKMTAALSKLRLLDVVGPLLCHFTCLSTLSLDLRCKGYKGTVHTRPLTLHGTFLHVAQQLAPSLADLTVYESPGSEWGWVTDEGLEVLGGAGVLRRLELWHSNTVTLQGLRHLMAGSPRFRRVCLTGGSVQAGPLRAAAAELGWGGEVEVH